MLPFGTRVTLNGHPEYIGVVIDLGASAAESYVVAWHHHKTNPLRPWYFRPELTVIESPAESALREIGRMLDLPPDAKPAAIVEALRSCVADPYTGPFGVTLAKEGRVIGRSIREASPAPAEETVWGEP